MDVPCRNVRALSILFVSLISNAYDCSIFSKLQNQLTSAAVVVSLVDDTPMRLTKTSHSAVVHQMTAHQADHQI